MLKRQKKTAVSDTHSGPWIDSLDNNLTCLTDTSHGMRSAQNSYALHFFPSCECAIVILGRGLGSFITKCLFTLTLLCLIDVMMDKRDNVQFWMNC